jgi:uncharacterized protein (AIM24 family)
MGGFTLRYPSLLKVRLENDSIQARRGSTAACRGGVRFEHQSVGLGCFFKKDLSSEGLNLGSVTGEGELFPRRPQSNSPEPQRRTDTVDGNFILAFEWSIDWDIWRVEEPDVSPAACSTSC